MPISAGSVVAVRLRWLLVIGLLTAYVLLLAMGSLAAVVGGGLSDWGKGEGGLDDCASVLPTVFGYVVGLAAAIATFMERRKVLVAVAVFATGPLISIGFLDVAQLASRGWWK